jgi:hypothetical protein
MIDFSTLVLGPCMDIFGECVDYYALTGQVQITGVFDEAYLPENPMGEIPSSNTFSGMGGITTVAPVLGIQLSQFPSGIYPAQGDRLVIVRTNATYFVKEIRVDSHGGAKLMLSFAAESPR